MTKLKLAGDVVSVNFEHNQVRLGVFPQGEAAVSSRVEVKRDGESFDFDPENARSRVDHIHSRLGESMDVRSQQDGALLIQFGDGYEWVCAPSLEYEAWTVASASTRWISAPGGEVIEYR